MYDSIDKAIDSDDVNVVLSGMNKDQFTDDRTADEMLGIKSKVIFSTRAYRYLLDLIGQSVKSKKESGAFFVGKEIGQTNQIFIDYYTSQFNPDEGLYGYGSAVTPAGQIPEMEKMVKENNCDCVVHFHVHTKDGRHYDGFADQDRKAYSWFARDPDFQFYSKEDMEEILGEKFDDNMYRAILNPQIVNKELRKHIQTIRNELKKQIPVHKKVHYFGMLATPDRPDVGKASSNYQLSLLYCEPYLKGEELRTSFYRFPNLYYLDEKNNIRQVGSFKRRNPPKLTNGRQVNNDNVSIQAIGKDPNTGETIEDDIVGKYKEGQFVFSNRTTPQDISNLARETVQNRPGELSEGVRKSRGFLSRILGKSKER